MGMQSSTRRRYLITVTIRTKTNKLRVPSSRKKKVEFIISTSANFFASGSKFLQLILPLIRSFNYALFVNRKLHTLIFFQANNRGVVQGWWIFLGNNEARTENEGSGGLWRKCSKSWNRYTGHFAWIRNNFVTISIHVWIPMLYSYH